MAYRVQILQGKIIKENDNKKQGHYPALPWWAQCHHMGP